MTEDGPTGEDGRRGFGDRVRAWRGDTAETGRGTPDRIGRVPTLLDPSLVALAVASTIVVMVGGLIQVSHGSYSMTIEQAWAAVFNPNVIFNPQAWDAFLLGEAVPEMSTESLIVWNIRLPRVLVAVLAGMCLAVSGAIFQAVTRNELASPFVLGVSSGAGFTVLLTLVVFSSLTPFLPLLAAVGGTLAFLIVYFIAWKDGTSPIRLVLAGVIVNMVFQSLQRAMFFFADDLGTVQSAMAWITGSLTGVGWEEFRIAAIPTLFAVLFALAGARQLNVLLLGEQTAGSLGMRVERVRFLLSAVAILAASAAIAVAGIISFFGLVVPHIVRLTVGSDYRKLIVGCVFAGPALMVAADVGARLALRPAQIPVGVVTGVVGGPYFLYLMRRQETLGEI
ncbi:iron complex transport system permease protein [Halorientalis persicus]|uniref:Cobalamin import system permease protein BtuC n=1 Tax=Halorientalis persicus TaxID=1367881 RepID=A0A1H8FG27_9EURY|nr:iron ABC transporter permease [Halorientalis persicus]SEN30464.1 iron complex transport system permease protein [Halorientalis persicus]